MYSYTILTSRLLRLLSIALLVILAVLVLMLFLVGCFDLDLPFDNFNAAPNTLQSVFEQANWRERPTFSAEELLHVLNRLVRVGDSLLDVLYIGTKGGTDLTVSNKSNEISILSHP